MKKILMVVALLILALVGYKILKPKHSDNNAPDTVSNTTAFEQIPANFEEFDDIPPSYVDDDPNSASNISMSAPVNTPVPVTTASPTFSHVMVESIAHK